MLLDVLIFFLDDLQSPTPGSWMAWGLDRNCRGHSGQGRRQRVFAVEVYVGRKKNDFSKRKTFSFKRCMADSLSLSYTFCSTNNVPTAGTVTSLSPHGPLGQRCTAVTFARWTSPPRNPLPATRISHLGGSGKGFCSTVYSREISIAQSSLFGGRGDIPADQAGRTYPHLKLADLEKKR